MTDINFSIQLTKWLSIWGGYYKGETGLVTIGILSDAGEAYWWVNLEVRIWKITFIGISITKE